MFFIDKKAKYIQSTQTMVGSQKKDFMDMQTGEIIHVDQVTKRTYGTKQFWKVYLMDFLSILGIIDNRQLDVFIYIAENTDKGNNLFVGTYKKIADETAASSGTIAKIMKKLQENNFIIKVQNGVWRVNPNILMKGNDTKRQILLSYYQEDKKENQRIEMLRGQTQELPEISMDDILRDNGDMKQKAIEDRIDD